MQEELWRAEVQAEALKARYTQRHPELRSLLAKITTLREQLSTMEPLSLKREVEAASATEREVNALYQCDVEKGKLLDEHRLKEEQLRQDANHVAARHEAALIMLKQKELAVQALPGDESGIIVRVLERALAPDEKMWPRPTLVLLPCALIRLVGGLGLIAIAERLRPRPVGFADARAMTPDRASDRSVAEGPR